MPTLHCKGLKADIVPLSAVKEGLLRLSYIAGKPILPLMLAVSLSNNTWWAVALLVAGSVITMMGMMAKILRHEIQLIKVVATAKKLRIKLEQNIKIAEVENNPEAAAASQAIADAKAVSTEDIQDGAEQTIDDDLAQSDDQSGSDVISTIEENSDAPDELSDNTDEVEPASAPSVTPKAA